MCLLSGQSFCLTVESFDGLSFTGQNGAYGCQCALRISKERSKADSLSGLSAVALGCRHIVPLGRVPLERTSN